MNEDPKELGALTGDSEEFSLPKAPPVPRPHTSRHSAPNQPKDQFPTAGEVAGDNASVPDIPATPKPRPRKLPPLQRHESPVHENRLEESLCAKAKEHDEESPPATKPHDSYPGRNGLIGVIVILLLVIVGLLIFMADSESRQQTTSNPIVSSPGEHEGRVNELQSENETMSEQLVEMTAHTKQLKEQLKTLSNARDKAVTDLGLANSAADRELTGLRAEVARLQTLARNSKPPQETTTTVREPISEPQIAGTVYRVSGLREGDTLNVRSGPGSGFSVVTQLQSGVRVTVTGAGVANGADWWLPCYLSGQDADPETGASKPWAVKGWINSAFLEEES